MSPSPNSETLPDAYKHLPDHYGYKTTTRYTGHAKGNAIDPSQVTLPRPFCVVVAGAGKGIGAAIAVAYAQAGASAIAISSRTMSDLETVAAQIKGIDARIDVFCRVADSVDESAVVDFAAAVRHRFGRLDVAVANVGVAPRFMKDPKTGEKRWPQSLTEDTAAEHLRVFNTNFEGSYQVARAFIPLLEDSKNGAQAMLFVSSLSSLFENADLTPLSYNLGKLAINSMCEYVHHAHHKNGIVTYAFHPGGIQTPMTSDYPEAWNKSGFAVWLTKGEKRDWLSGRFVNANWDVEELVAQKDAIASTDRFKMRMVL